MRRPQLFQILRARATSLLEHHICNLIERIFANTVIEFDNLSTILTNKGVFQGAKLSPALFNVYLEAALLSQPTIKRLIDEERLLAYADDIVVKCTSLEETEAVIKELELIGQQFSMVVSIDKSKILNVNSGIKIPSQGILGVKQITSYKYLGLTLFHRKKEILKCVSQKIGHVVAGLKRKMLWLRVETAILLMREQAYSILRYLATPLLRAGVVKAEDVDRMERKIIRCCFGFQTTLGNEATEEVIGGKTLATKILETSDQREKHKLFKGKCPKWLLEGALRTTQMVVALSRGHIHHKPATHRFYCRKHACPGTLDHAIFCFDLSQQ